MNRILPEYETVLDEEIEEAVFQALGAASMCWDYANVFDSECAKQIGEELLGIIRQYRNDCEETVEEPPFDENHYRYHTPNKPLHGCEWCRFLSWSQAMSKNIEPGRESRRQGLGGRPGRAPGRGYSGSARTTTGGISGRPSKGWGSTGGPAKKDPKSGRFWDWLSGRLRNEEDDE